MNGRAGVLLAVVVALDAALWAAGGPFPTETFAWFRIQDRMGPAGFVGAAVAGLVGALVATRARGRVQGLALAAVTILSLGASAGAPQAQVDALEWFTRAQTLARGDWPPWLGGGGGLRMPGLPLVDALAFRLLGESEATVAGVRVGWLLLLVSATALGAPRDRRGALLAVAVVASTPLLAAQGAWMLADLPLVALLACTWAAARRGAPLAVVLAFAALAFAVKPAAALWALFTLPAMLPRRRAIPFAAGAAVLVVAALAAGRLHPRLRPLSLDAQAGAAMLLALRAPLLVGAGWLALRARPVEAAQPGAPVDPLPRLVGGVLAALAVVVTFAPPAHAARYALPAVVPLAWMLAEQARGPAGWLVGSGLVLTLRAFVPLATGSQAGNVREAVQALEAAGADGIEVVADTPGGALPVAALAALVDVTANVPVVAGAQITLAPPGDRPRWYHHYPLAPWHRAGPTAPNTILVLCTPGADCAPPPDAGAEIVDTHRWHGTSLDLPTRARGFRRLRP